MGAFDDDLVKHEDNDNPSLGPGNLTVNVVGLASFEADFPPSACAAAKAAWQALQQGEELVWFLDAIVCMNSAVM